MTTAHELKVTAKGFTRQVDIFCQICGTLLNQEYYDDGKFRVYPCSSNHCQKGGE